MPDRVSSETAVESALREAVHRAVPGRLRSALMHAVFAGGGRIRPRVCLAVACAASDSGESSLTYAAAAAVELIHCASLVHDDLPCFDDAELRRGRPSVHFKYGQATAVLAGDALIIAAFDVLARAGAPSSFIVTLAKAAGAQGGLVAGQALELESNVDVAQYHGAKTAGLFEAAAVFGAASVGASPALFEPLGRALGLFYQYADDVADAYGSPTALGKPVGRDRDLRRPSAVVARTSTPSREEAFADLSARARAVVDAVPDCPGDHELRQTMSALVDAIVARSGICPQAPRPAPGTYAKVEV